MATTNASARMNPLAELEAVGQAEASRRATARASNRARFPLLAEWMDAIGPDAKLVWAQDEAGEIGKVPRDNWVEIENFPRPYVHPKGKRL